MARQRCASSSARGARRAAGPDVAPSLLEDVVGHEHDRHGARHLRDLLLAADALLQRGEGQRAIVAKRQHLAVEHGAVRQVRRRGGDFRKTVRDQLFAARPQMHVARARRTSCARMPSHFHSTSQSARGPSDRPAPPAATPGRTDRARAIARRSGRATEAREPAGRRRPVAHHPRRDRRWPGVPRPICASARTTSVCDTPTRSSPVRIFEQHEALKRDRACATTRSTAPLRRRIEVAQREDPLLDPLGQRDRPRRRRPRPDRGRAPRSRRRRRRRRSISSSHLQAGRRERPVADRGDATSRFRRRPVRKNTAHAASAGGASPKYVTIAATLRWSTSCGRWRRTAQRSVHLQLASSRQHQLSIQVRCSAVTSLEGSPSQAVRMIAASSPRPPDSARAARRGRGS